MLCDECAVKLINQGIIEPLIKLVPYESIRYRKDRCDECGKIKDVVYHPGYKKGSK